jgi:glucose-6-phosphate isomerase
VNAYHQPGVEAGKKAAEEVIALERRVLALLAQDPDEPLDAEQVARSLGPGTDVETVHHLLEHLAHNPGRGVKREGLDPGTRDGHLKAKFRGN